MIVARTTTIKGTGRPRRQFNEVRYTLIRKSMNQPELLREIISTYERHGWKLRRVLLRSSTRVELTPQIDDILNAAALIDSEFDALWFARPSHQNREAWGLRLLAQQPYALFEAFESDETEEEREEARRERENRMRAHAAQS